jgi:choline dehydrogenase-like flavoprotein
MQHKTKDKYDAVIIGSGFGGSLAARELVNAGKNVLMLERGSWVERGEHNWAPNGSIDLTPFYSHEINYHVLEGGNKPVMGAYCCVGGPSVFYGTVSMRFREADFIADEDIITDSGAEWPFNYDELEPYYCQAEHLIGISGQPGSDPTEPVRSHPYPSGLNSLSKTARLICDAAETLGYNPFRLPLAINYKATNGQQACIDCPTCDTFACAIEAKNDLATTVLRDLLKKDLTLLSDCIATKIVTDRNKITAIHYYDKKQQKTHQVEAGVVVVAAGAIASPHLLLASGLDKKNSAGHVIGRYLTRHCNAIAFGFFARQPGDVKEYHKQLGIHDFYFGHPSIKHPKGKLGSIQQLQTPPIGLIHAMLPLGCFMLGWPK